MVRKTPTMTGIGGGWNSPGGRMNLNKYKRMVVDDHLENKPCVGIMVDTLTDGVKLPESQVDKLLLPLLIGHDMDPPIPDLWVDDEGIVGTLTFDEEAAVCTIPWVAVVMIYDDGDQITFLQK